MNFETYERNGQHYYAALASTVASILSAAIGAEGNAYRLQQVKSRAKEPASLRVKLEKRGESDTDTLESAIKDLAGCRIIFYTDGDVARFLQSGIIQENFEVLEQKVHHPRRTATDAADLYTSNHYVVKLSPARLELPEYGRFADLRCEIQIQTILNHAWAEMAHDTIYKAPDLADFGSRAFRDIEARLRSIAARYLVPAGHEFQKVTSDFERLVAGKQLFDGRPLVAAAEALDNNVRADAIESFAQNVLPFCDDPGPVYPDVAARLLEAVRRAREMPPTPVDTPFGTFRGKTCTDIVKATTGIFLEWRYVDVETTFNALCTLYVEAGSPDERKPLLKVADALAQHHLEVWKRHGPAVQAMLLEQMTALDDEQLTALQTLLVRMLGDILGTEVRGTTASSSAITLQTGAVMPSDGLREMRTQGIGLLKRLFALSRTDEERRVVLRAMESGMRLPFRGGYGEDLRRMLTDDMGELVRFYTTIASTLDRELLRNCELWVHHCYWAYAFPPADAQHYGGLEASRASLVAAAIAFRDVVNGDSDFVIYKTLVGHDSILEPAWHDEAFRYARPEDFRKEQIDRYVSGVDSQTAGVWFDRISRYAQTQSDDAATFTGLTVFLSQLARQQPGIVLDYLSRMDASLERFLPWMLEGLLQSTDAADVLAVIDTWLAVGEHLQQLTWYLRIANPFDETLLQRALAHALQSHDQLAVRNAILAADMQYAAHPGTLIESVLLPALKFLHTCNDVRWLHGPWITWHQSKIMLALNATQADIVLDALLRYPKLESSAQNVVAAIAGKWPAYVLEFLHKRLALARSDDAPDGYDALPFSAHELKVPLAAAPDLVIQAARGWFLDDPEGFANDGGQLLVEVFSGLGEELTGPLAQLIAGGDGQDLAFAVAVLSARSGEAGIFPLLRQIVAALPPVHPLLRRVAGAIRQTGVVSGEFGYPDALEARKTLLQEWLDVPDERVHLFAQREIHDLTQTIAAETRAAEARIAHRRLQFGESLDGDPDSHSTTG
jgi:ppGpp synthetase/RelA/SpoT-type nucleotidyltranferase